jgi:hypothetical protein
VNELIVGDRRGIENLHVRQCFSNRFLNGACHHRGVGILGRERASQLLSGIVDWLSAKLRQVDAGWALRRSTGTELIESLGKIGAGYICRPKSPGSNC